MVYGVIRPCFQGIGKNPDFGFQDLAQFLVFSKGNFHLTGTS
jgi:hypothetical protein